MSKDRRKKFNLCQWISLEKFKELDVNPKSAECKSMQNGNAFESKTDTRKELQAIVEGFLKGCDDIK